jgi:hypothetical protein
MSCRRWLLKQGQWTRTNTRMQGLWSWATPSLMLQQKERYLRWNRSQMTSHSGSFDFCEEAPCASRRPGVGGVGSEYCVQEWGEGSGGNRA